ncbi:MAG: UvrD-helicase domain-containing protein [Anaerolineae bacterium]|nr:UvrD-helicase domain-containing protein [Anaerolineae bacterium]
MTGTEALLRGLNPQQHAAVTAGTGPVLVLAGPGSGKTGVLTRRVAFLIREMQVRPAHIMAVTFTNKAAGEMRQRIESYLGAPAAITVGTFHAICARLLRIEHASTPYSQDFVIFDTDDQVKAIEQALHELNIDSRKFNPRSLLAAISSHKNEMKLPHQAVARDYLGEVVARVYPRYQAILLDNNALDFDDLLLQMVVLLQQHAPVREKYQQRFGFVLVDEFQDTNTVQYHLVRLFGRPQDNLFAVGDEDQSIYAFRGADYRNVQRFRQDFPAAQVILLEQNYRSTQVVLDTARAVIDRNTNRTPKALFTTQTGGDKITIHEAYDEEYEARFIVEQVEALKRRGGRYQDVAVMYRTNAQSRALEDKFIKEGIPYTLVGGVGFYKRREVRDLMAYLRVVNNPNDKISFARIINVPKRGIGDKSLQEFQALAAERGWTYADLLAQMSAGARLPLAARTTRLFMEFGEKLHAWQQQAQTGHLVALFDAITADTGYHLHVQQISTTPEEAAERSENLRELRGLLLRADAEDKPLGEWLIDQSLMTDVEEVRDTADKVTLLTLHAAKGLEYPVVFITGLEEGLLPHMRALDDGAAEDLQEERRLLYVGITRARQRLYLTYAFRRMLWGSSDVRKVSRFLADIPAHLVDSLPDTLLAERSSASYRQQTTWDTPAPRPARPAPAAPGPERSRLANDLAAFRQQLQQPAPPLRPPAGKVIPFPGQSAGSTQYQPGQRVKHPLFGPGLVQASKLDAGEELVTVRFEDARYGTKTLMASLANMSLLHP